MPRSVWCDSPRSVWCGLTRYWRNCDFLRAINCDFVAMKLHMLWVLIHIVTCMFDVGKASTGMFVLCRPDQCTA